jgi:predicted branched-subunit amino acid permease
LALSGAVGVFALAFGVLAVGAGANVWQACALSFFTFTGASQMSAMTVIGTGGSVGGALGGALLLAGRNGVYGLALSPYFNESLGKRLLAANKSAFTKDCILDNSYRALFFVELGHVAWRSTRERD